MQPQYYGAAAQYNKPGSFKNRKLIMVLLLGVIIIVFLSIGFALVNFLMSGPANQFARLVARQEALQQFVSDGQAEIKNDDLSKINSTANVLLLTDAAALRNSLRTAYRADGVPADITRSESNTEQNETILKEAVQINRYDTAYYNLLQDKITAALQLAQHLQPDARGNAQTSVQQAVTSLQAIQKELTDLKL